MSFEYIMSWPIILFSFDNYDYIILNNTKFVLSSYRRKLKIPLALSILHVLPCYIFQFYEREIHLIATVMQTRRKMKVFVEYLLHVYMI